MERCDFASITNLIRSDLLDGSFQNQLDFVECLFQGYEEETESYFDMGLVSKWLNGLSKPSPAMAQYYRTHAHAKELAITIEDVILPSLSDSAMTVQNLYALLIGDTTISENKKSELSAFYPCKDHRAEAIFLTELLVFGMNRPFVARDIRKPNLLPSGRLSPVVLDYIIDGGVPSPCRHFCGRETELAALHDALIRHRVIFVQGIPGIGKSELIKAYAKAHKKEYTNILYLIYSGSLKQDIADLMFADDRAEDDENMRFRKHNRFLRTLKEDSLLIIDNFELEPARDELLDVVLKYRCRIVFTTRSIMDGQFCLPVQEISDTEQLFQMVTKLYSGAEKHRREVVQIIEAVHRHTFAVELAARLLETGILKPRAVLKKLCTEKASFDSADKIGVTKDGKRTKATYYDHIHTLYGLFRLSTAKKEIIRNLTLIPLTGIPARLLGEWMKLSDLNDVNELVEMGFVQSTRGRRLSLHPMMQEVTISELPPSMTACRIMLKSIRLAKATHGTDLPYHKLMFEVVENAVELAEKDDLSFYYLVLQDVFMQMEDYHYESGMRLLLCEMERIIREPTLDTPYNRAILCNCRFFLEKDDTDKAIATLKTALDDLSVIQIGNALLAANLNANLGSLYRQKKDNIRARIYMEKAMEIQEQFGLYARHDSLIQCLNYATLLCELGESERGLRGVQKLERMLLSEGGSGSSDHALVIETMAIIYLTQSNFPQAQDHFYRSMQMYATLWADDPQLIADKMNEIRGLYSMVGYDVPPIIQALLPQAASS